MQTSQRQCQPATPGASPLRVRETPHPSAARLQPPGYLHGRVCKCRKRSNAGVPGATAPGKIILESPPSPPGKGVGGYPSPSGKGGRIKNQRRGRQAAKNASRPCKHHSGRSSQYRKKQKTLRKTARNPLLTTHPDLCYNGNEKKPGTPADGGKQICFAEIAATS